jgi:hypothetical protein
MPNSAEHNDESLGSTLAAACSAQHIPRISCTAQSGGRTAYATPSYTVGCIAACLRYECLRQPAQRRAARRAATPWL